MRVNFLVNEVFDGWEPTDKRLGGTEESVVKWAEELCKMGHASYVWRNSNKSAYKHNGVMYLPRDQYGKLVRNLSWENDLSRKVDGDSITINIKSSEVAPIEPTLYLTNETNASDLDLSAYAGVIWPSRWAVDNMPVNNPKTFILPHGYDNRRVYPGVKLAKQCFYASSPDRGLEQLLEIWPEVHEKHPDATLLVTYGGEIDLPGVINLGEVDEDTMNEIYRSSDIWCHPCNGGELYCMTGKKAQAAGCIPVIIPTMALAETVNRGFKTDKEGYAQTLIEVLDMPMEARNAIRRNVIENAYIPNWKESTDKLEEIINSII